MQGKAESGEKAQCTWEYMSILSRFPTQHGAARDFFNSLLDAPPAGQIHCAQATTYLLWNDSLSLMAIARTRIQVSYSYQED
jgi:hypothetical protein